MTRRNRRRFRWHLVMLALLLVAGCQTSTLEETPIRATPGSASNQGDKDQCPPIRNTPRAPERYYQRQNPLEPTPENLTRGKHLYLTEAEPIPCAECHGANGDGKGPMGRHLQPPPTDFTCAELMEALPDGHLFWVVSTGAGFFEQQPGHTRQAIKRPGRRARATAMRGHRNYLTDHEIWQLILYVRTFAE